MLIVEREITEIPQNLPAMPAESYQWPDGIAPPLKQVRKRRFRKRFSKRVRYQDPLSYPASFALILSHQQ
jgi:TATA-binding protein-associated factor Taf7